MRRLTRRGVLLALLLLVWAFAVSTVQAHPLGNFTVNHYARIELSGDALALRYVLDMAEIPSVQETRAADTDGDGVVSGAEWDAYRQRKAAEITRQLELTVDGAPIPLEPTDVVVSQPLGQGDIPLVRLEMWLRPTLSIAPNQEHHATFRDRTDPTRLGWRELVVHSGRGATLADSDVPSQDVSEELRAYPDNLVQNPLDRREAHWSFTLDGSSAADSVQTAATPVRRPTDAMAGLVTPDELNPTVVVLAVAAALLLGGIHAASPGHGKSIMAAYIVGRHGTILHAAALAISVTLAHTTGVLVLGILTLVASNLIFPDQLYPWLTLISGAIVLVVGGQFLVLAVRGRTPSHDHDHHHQHQHEAHADSHEHSHQHGPQGGQSLGPTWRGLFALGLAGGIVPSGSALVVLLSSIALGRLGFGLVLIVAFGFGMAVVLVTTGVVLVHARQLIVRFVPLANQQRLAGVVPLLSAGLMTLLGLVSTLEGLSQTRLLGL